MGDSHSYRSISALPKRTECRPGPDSAADYLGGAVNTRSRCALTALTVVVLQLRKDINAWVAKYRRDDKFSGKPSFG